jgi:methylenetetrahydrofolate reductase (NADPH)
MGSEPDRLRAAFEQGRFAITAEISPPVSTDLHDVLVLAEPLRDVATAVNVTDGAGAKAHLSSLAAASALVQSGIEPVLQMTCRDRNRLALQGDLLGAAALGIRNFLLLSGDDPKTGDQPETKPVFDLDGRGLLAVAHRMRSERRLPPGSPIKGSFAPLLGGAEVPVDPTPGWQPTSLLAKADAGADFVQTQFCMDMGIVRRYAARLTDLGLSERVKVLIGIAPLPSLKSAHWMQDKLFGTQISEEIMSRLAQAPDARQEGKRICIELLQQLAETPGIAGAHVMAPQNPRAIPEVIAASGVLGVLRAGQR